jgi:hypothetical protein
MALKNKIFQKDHRQTKSLEQAGNEASTNAVRHAKALDITITYIKDGGVYEEQANGTIVLKRKVEKKENPFVLTKGMVLHAK